MNNNKFQPVAEASAGRRKPILCVGTTPCLQRSLRFGALRMGEVNRSATVRLGASGKATNVARVLRALGEPCLLVSLVGGGTGRLFSEFLKEEGLAHIPVHGGAVMRICETIIEQAPHRVTELVEELAQVTTEDWAQLEREIEIRARESDWVLFSGTLPPDSDVCGFRRVLDAAGRNGAKVLLDTSGKALMAGLESRPWGVKVNQRELETTLGVAVRNEAMAEAALRRFASTGLAWAGVTRGSEPAWWWDGQDARVFEVPSVQVVSPIGSGDAVLAGLAAGLNRGLPAAEAFRLGLACGCANAETDWPGELSSASAGRWKDLITSRPMGRR